MKAAGIALTILVAASCLASEPTRIRLSGSRGWSTPAPDENEQHLEVQHAVAPDWRTHVRVDRQRRFHLTDTFLSTGGDWQFGKLWGMSLEGGLLPAPAGEHVLPRWQLGTGLYFPLPAPWSGETNFIHRSYQNARVELFSLGASFEGVRDFIIIPRLFFSRTTDTTTRKSGTAVAGNLKTIYLLSGRQRVWIGGGGGQESAAIGSPVELRALHVFEYSAGYQHPIDSALTLGIEGLRQKYPEVHRDTWKLGGSLEVSIW